MPIAKCSAFQANTKVKCIAQICRSKKGMLTPTYIGNNERPSYSPNPQNCQTQVLALCKWSCKVCHGHQETTHFDKASCTHNVACDVKDVSNSRRGP
jgi:hypothetical protein